MNPSDEAEIKRLTTIYVDKKSYVDALAIMNTPTEPDKAREAHIRYLMAIADAENAMGALQRAKIRMMMGQPAQEGLSVENDDERKIVH